VPSASRFAVTQVTRSIDGLPAPTDSPTNLANESGFPDLIVPAGMTWSGLPVTISFFGQAFSEGQVLAYGYDFEQATKARVLPKHLQLGKRPKHAARRESPCPLARIMHEGWEFCGNCGAKRPIHVANRCLDELPRLSALRHSHHDRRYSASLRAASGTPQETHSGF
jgi:hypothetical protein